MIRLRALAVFLAAALFATACGADPSPPTPPDAVQVVVTTSILGDLLTPFAAPDVQIHTLMPNGADPHDWEPSSRDVVTVRQADLVVAVGLGLEEGLGDVLAAAAADVIPVLEIAPLVDPLPFHDPHREERGHDEDHGDLDPHVWLDPVRMQTAVDEIATALTRLEPEGSWNEVAADIREGLRAAHHQVAELVSGIPEDRRLLVAGHDVLGYFADRYGFTVVGVLIPGGSTLGDASSRDLAELVEAIRAAGAPAIFTETTVSSDLADTVSKELGRSIDVVSLHTAALGPAGSGAEHYPGMLVENARLIADALGG